MHFNFKAEHIGVERDRRIDIVYDVTNTDLAHIVTLRKRTRITVRPDGDLSKLYIASLAQPKCKCRLALRVIIVARAVLDKRDTYQVIAIRVAPVGPNEEKVNR